MIRGTSEMPYADLQALGIEVTAPGSQASLAGGWPLPSESVPADAMQHMGFQDSDRFVCFLPSDANGTAKADVDRMGSEISLQIPLEPAKTSAYAVIAIPTPTANQVAGYKAWLRRGT